VEAIGYSLTERLQFGTGVTCPTVHQIGPDQNGFLRFYERDVLPRLGVRAVT
jgi:hypothetical protein